VSCNPPITTLGETASSLQVFPKGTVVRACWCSIRTKLCAFPCANKWFYCWDQDLLEGMSRWLPSKTKIQKWIEEQEKDFPESQNKNPNLSTKACLGRYIFTDIHKIFFGGIHQELYEWLAMLADTHFEIRLKPPVVWTLSLIKKVKRVDNAMSGSLDHLFDSTIGGYITEFVIDRV
jgi:hypothetical protein